MNNTTKAALGVIIVILVIWGISKTTGSKSVDSTKEPIKIGAVISLTGSAAPWGEYGKKAMELAVKEINAKGGIDGRQVNLLIEDDHTDGKQAVSGFNKLVSIDHVNGIIGGVFDFTAQPLLPLAHNEKITFISPSNFRIAGGFELNDQSFVMMSDFNKVLAAMKTYLGGENVQKLAVVHFKSTFGKEIATTLDTIMKDLGHGGIVEEEYTQIGNNDFKTTIAKLKAQNVDAVFLDTLGSDSVNFITRAKQANFKPAFISYNGLTDAFAEEKDKSLLENVVILNWEVTRPEFANLFQDSYGIAPSKSADKFYDAVYVLAQGIAGSKDNAQVASTIENSSYTTPNGEVKFTADHAAQSTNVKIQIIKQGKLVDYTAK
ncbi:MAG: Extracellular ligand-binding receptor [Parcubacteria group bacterium]|nr:Extracellular ligand-binding receptor [Parcubacteria group bacterium]